MGHGAQDVLRLGAGFLALDPTVRARLRRKRAAVVAAVLGCGAAIVVVVTLALLGVFTTTHVVRPAPAGPGGKAGPGGPAGPVGVPTIGYTPICGTSVLHSPFGYRGATGSYTSGTAGLPTFGSPKTNFPNATSGTVVSASNPSGIGDTANRVYFMEAGTYDGLSISYSNGDVFVGASGGTIMDGGSPTSGNIYAFTGNGAPGKDDGTVEYLTVQHYRPTTGEGAMSFTFETGWSFMYDTITDNYYGGGIWMGSSSRLTYSCIERNGQEGFGTGTVNNNSLTKGPQNVTVSKNEIAYNDTCNWENSPHFPIAIPKQCGRPDPGFSGCGCSGAGKFWATYDYTFNNNYVHDDYSAGMWADADDVGGDIENNYFAHEWASPLTLEISYNALIKNNAFIDNGWGDGGSSADVGDAAIGLHNAGGDPTVPGFHSGAITITDNTMIDNWEGVVEYMEGGRWCDNPGFPEYGSGGGSGYCTLTNPNYPAPSPFFQQSSTTATTGCGKYNLWTHGARLGSSVWKPGAVTGGPPSEDYYDGCIWADKNISVTHNTVSFHPADITGGYAWTPCRAATVGNVGNWCGLNTDFAYYDGGSVWGGTIYAGNWESWVTNPAPNPTGSGNRWDDNKYIGTQIMEYQVQGGPGCISFATWQSHGLDAHSTMR